MQQPGDRSVATGLGRVKTTYRMNGAGGNLEGLWLCPDRRHEWPDAHDVHDAGQIVGKYVQRHL
jgi:hypothetical protein